MAFRAALLVLVGSTRAALAAEGGLRGPAAPDAPLNGSAPEGGNAEATWSNESVLEENGWEDEDLAANGSLYEDSLAALPSASNVSVEMELEDTTSLDMFLESFSEEIGSSLENVSLDARTQWWWHHHHHHHHHYGGGTVLTLFHQTSREAGHSILRSGFRPGSQGWCGGGIYFATSPQATYLKAIGPDSHQGYIIGAKVNVGRVKYMGKTCDRSMTGWKLHGWGYDSIHFNPGDGDEYVVYSKARIISIWHH